MFGTLCSLLFYTAIFLFVRKIFYIVLSYVRVDYKNKAVLITGCDSGFGLLTTKKLASKGVQVFSACLTEQGVEELKKESNVIPFLMDVTNEKSVAEAYEFVKSKVPKEGLWALINNAGVLRSGELEFMSLDYWRLQINVNVMGIAITTKQFLPLIRQAKGRIINVASIAGRFSTPATSAYNASKYAVEGLSDSWRRELSIWGVKVILIEPGIMKTPLWDVPISEVVVDKLWSTLTPDQQERYGKEYFIECEKSAKELIKSVGGNPNQVVTALENAVCSKYPNTRYVLGLDTYLWLFLTYLPTLLSDAIIPLVLRAPTPAALKKKK